MLAEISSWWWWVCLIVLVLSRTYDQKSHDAAQIHWRTSCVSVGMQMQKNDLTWVKSWRCWRWLTQVREGAWYLKTSWMGVSASPSLGVLDFWGTTKCSYIAFSSFSFSYIVFRFSRCMLMELFLKLFFQAAFFGDLHSKFSSSLINGQKIWSVMLSSLP